MISGGVSSMDDPHRCKKLMQVPGRILSSLGLAESSLALAPPPRWRWWFSIVYITHTPTHPLHTVMYTIKYSMPPASFFSCLALIKIFGSRKKGTDDHPAGQMIHPVAKAFFMLLWPELVWSSDAHQTWWGVHWCNPSLRGWSADWGSQGNPGWLKSTNKQPNPLI